MKSVYRAAIIGCGAAAGGYDEMSGFRHIFTHAGAYTKHPRFELIAAADTDKKKLTNFKRIWGIAKVYADYRKMLEGQYFDLVSVCVPDCIHSAVIKEIIKLRAARSILSEKPMVTASKDAYDIVRACSRGGISIFVNSNRLWEPAHFYVRELVRKGFLGNIESCIAYYARGLIHNGTTMIRTLSFLLNDEVLSVKAVSASPCEIKDDFAVDGLLEFKNIEAYLASVDKKGYGHSIFEIDLMGNKGRIRITDNGYDFQFYKTGEYSRYGGFKQLVKVPLRSLRRYPKNGMDRTLMATLDEIAGSIDHNENSVECALDAAKDLRVAEALIKSANNGFKKIIINKTELLYANTCDKRR